MRPGVDADENADLELLQATAAPGKINDLMAVFAQPRAPPLAVPRAGPRQDGGEGPPPAWPCVIPGLPGAFCVPLGRA